MEDVAQKITKLLYGDDYDNSKYENILSCLNDFEKLAESFNELITDFLHDVKKLVESSNELEKPLGDDE